MLQIIYVISEEYNVVALLCKMHNFFYLFHPFTRRVPICDMDELRKRLVVARAEFQQSVVDDAFINGEKDWKYVSEQNVWSLWTFAVMLLAWHSICHTSHPVLFRSTNANPQPAFFQSYQRLEECNIPSVRWKSCALYKVVLWHFSDVVGKGLTVCFLLR